MGDPIRQPVDNFTALYEQANVSPPLLNEAGSNITTAMRQQFPELLRDVDFSQGPVKAFDRSAAKLVDSATGSIDPTRASGITDLVRGRIIVETPEQIEAIRTFLTNNADDLGIVNVKDRFARPSGTHYRDINLSVQLENGHIAEIQINQRDMLAASDFTHDAYEEIDAIQKRATLEGRRLNTEEITRTRNLNEFIQDVHDRGAARVDGIDTLLSEEGRSRLETDYEGRRQRNPDFEVGVTLNNESKYGAITDAHPNFLDLSEVNGGRGYKALRDALGITVDGLEISPEALATLERPRVQWDRANNTVIAESPEVLDEVLARSGVSRERLGELGINTTYNERLSRNLSATVADNARNPLSDSDVNPQRDGDVVQRTGNDIPPEGGNNSNPRNGVDPNPLSDIDANPRSDEITPNQQGDRPSLTEEFRRADTGSNVQVDAPDAPTLSQGADGSGTTSPLRTASDAGDTADALPPSKWRAAVEGAGGSGRVASNITTHAMAGTGFALSAFHLQSQLLDENSTFHRDLQNDDVDGRAITALSLDATAFAVDSVVIGQSALQTARVLRAADSLADVARASTALSTTSKFARVAGPVGLGITVVTTGLEYSIAETNEDGRRAGQAVGAGGGALAGAGIGAGLTWWLGPGAGIGAAVGGLIGAFSGGYAGGEYLDDDFQEYFDENALAEQRRNLDKIEDIGTGLQEFIRLEGEVATAYETLERRFEALNTNGQSEADILAMTDAQRASLEAAARAYEEKRTELAQHVQGAFLSSSEEQTLDDVQEFIEQRYAFLDMKEGRLREAGDTEALQRLARDRTGLEEAHRSITRLQGTNANLGENYGTTSSEISRISQENISSVWSSVRAQNAHVADYQAAIQTNQAIAVQRSYETQLERQLERVNTSYNGGQTDNTLMHRSATLMGLVESGELDAEMLGEARQEIEALQSAHDEELSGLRSSQQRLLSMTREQRGLRGDEYAGDYARHNLSTLSVVNGRVADLVQTHETTSEIAGHAMSAAESAVEIHNLTAQLHVAISADTQPSNITGTQAVDVQAPDVTDERASAIYQIKSDIAEQSIDVAEHSEAILSIIGQDMKDRLDDVQANLLAEQEKAIPNTDTVAALQQVSEALIQVSEGKMAEIEAYQTRIRGMLENGVSIDGENFQIVSPDQRQRLETILQDAQSVRTQYSEEITQTREQMRSTEADVSARALEQDGVSVTLDHSGRVSSYSVEDSTRRFRGDQRPMLVDNDGNIYNNTSELNIVDMDLALYSPRMTITQLGEPYQSYWRPDIVHLNEIEDEAEREQVRAHEAELVDGLKRKTIGDAISAPPTATDSDETMGANIIVPASAEIPDDSMVQNDPAYLEVVIAMEKIRAGETLDDVEQDNIRRILSDPSIDPQIIEQLNEEYGPSIESLQQVEDVVTSDLIPAQVPETVQPMQKL